MSFRKILAPFVAVLLVASASCGDDSNNNNNNNDGDTDNNNGDNDNTVVTYTLTRTTPVNGTLSADPTGPTYEAGTVVTLTAAPGAGFKVASWTGTDNDASTSPINHVTMSADKTVSVSFTPTTAATYTLTLTAGSNGTVVASPVGPTFSDGTSVTLTATPAGGYMVDSWTGTDDDTKKTNTNTITMTGNKTVNVTFRVFVPQHTLTVTFSAGDGGLWGFYADPPNAATLQHVSPTTLTYDENTVVTLTGHSTTHWPFEGWTGQLTDSSETNSTQCTIEVTMDIDRAITANIPDVVGSGVCP